MIGRREVLGLSLLSALLLCAFAGQSARAATAVNTTAFTCVSVGENKGEFKDSHCDQNAGPGKGAFNHESITTFVDTEVELTNEKITGETKNSEPAVIKSKAFGTKIEVTCTKVSNIPFVNEEKIEQQAYIHNIHGFVFGEHTVTGQLKLRLSSCTVNLPLKCKVKEPLDSEILEFRGREELGAGKKEMGVEFNGGGPEILFTITFESKGAEECALKGQSLQLKGTAIATSGPTTESSQTNKWSGSTLLFSPKNEMQKLKVGAEVAEFSAGITMRGAGGGPPIALTTTT